MAVYVDNMEAKLGRMTMCHIVADTTDELLAMAAKIGVAPRWLQSAGTAKEHFDVCLAKRKAAITAGAREIDVRDTARLVRAKRDAWRLSTNKDSAAGDPASLPPEARIEIYEAALEWNGGAENVG